MSAPLSDDQVDALSVQPAAVAPSSSAGQPLTDADIDADATAAPGKLESFGRGMSEGASFGFDDKIGMSHEAREASRKANPWTHFAGEVVGGIAPMAASYLLPNPATTPLAVARTAQLGSRVLGGIRSLMVPGEMNTLRQTLGQSAKLGATYGGLSGMGHADVKPEDGWAASLSKRGQGLVTGATVGAALGVPLGAAGYGASRLASSVMSRVSPELKQVSEALAAPEAQGTRDVMRQAGYDKYGQAEFAKLKDDLANPANAERYANLNLIEALESRPVQPISGTGELKPPVAVSPNLRSQAQDWANTEGRGRQLATEAFANRRNEQASRLSQDIDKAFGSSAMDLAADAEALIARKAALNKRFDKMRDKPLTITEDLGRMQQNSVFKKAMEYAAQNDTIANPGSDFARAWSSGSLQDTIVTMSPSNVLDIHHALVMNAKPPIGGATPESVMAGRLKRWFGDWVDNQFKGHAKLNQDYAFFKRTMEAQERAAELPLNSGGKNHESLKFIEKALADRDKAVQAANRRLTAYDTAMQRYQNGQRATMPRITDINNDISRIEAHNSIVETYQRFWGDRIKQEIAASTDGGNAVVRKLLTQEGKNRILKVLGPEKGVQFIEALYNKYAQMGLSKTLYGNSDTAYKLGRNSKADALMDAVHGITHLRPMQTLKALGELGSAAYKQRRADQGNELFSRQGPEEVGKIVDAILARYQLRTAAHPYIMNPTARALGPTAGAVQPYGPASQERQPALPPYRKLP